MSCDTRSLKRKSLLPLNFLSRYLVISTNDFAACYITKYTVSLCLPSLTHNAQSFQSFPANLHWCNLWKCLCNVVSSIAKHPLLTTIHVNIYVLDKALPRVLYGKYSTKEWARDKHSTRRSRVLYFVSRPLFECYISCIARAKDSALSGIENCQLEVHTRHTKQLETHEGVLSSVE